MEGNRGTIRYVGTEERAHALLKIRAVDIHADGATTNDVHYIRAYGELVAVFSSDNAGVTSTHLTDTTGSMVQTLSYDVCILHVMPGGHCTHAGPVCLRQARSMR